MAPLTDSKPSPTENVIYHANGGIDGGNEILENGQRID